MARIRSIKPAFFTSEDTCACSPLARLLFLGLLTEADKAGRVEDRPRQLKRRLLPDDDCDVDALLWELVDRTLIQRYVVGGVDVIQVLNFLKHQKPHPKEAESVLPALGAVKPRLNPASREQVVIHPVENPPSPARNGSGDLNDGYGDLGAGAVSTMARPLVSGMAHPMTWAKTHGSHVAMFCDFVCLPELVFSEFVMRVRSGGASDEAAKDQVMLWAKQVRAEWQASGQIPGDTIFDFWRNEWKKTHGSNRPAAGAVDVLAGLR